MKNNFFNPGILFLIFLLLISGCAPRKKGGAYAETGENSLPRASPGYVQWLERQSLLYAANDFSRMVSGSDRAFIAPSTGDNVQVLLKAADIWLDLRPAELITSGFRPVLRDLAESGFLDMLDRAGIKGVHLAPLGESGGIWRDPHKADVLGGDQVSLGNAENVGTDKDFELLAARAEAKGIQLGSDILPAATGIGPDFFLSARNVRDFPGLYLMSEAPKEIWPLLPSLDSERHGAGLDEKIMLAAGRGRRPANMPVMARDRLPFAQKGGWAATGEIIGVDGVKRRWIYRYAQSPDYPVFNWDDPSGAARKILSASIIRQTGTMRMALMGLPLEPFFGLDPAPEPEGKYSLEPGPSAVKALSREVRRYGGWSLFTSPMPAALSAEIQEAGADFAMDSFTFPAAEYALITGDAAPLKRALQNSLDLRIDQRRLARFMPGRAALDFRLCGKGSGADYTGKVEAVLKKRPDWAGRIVLKNNKMEITPATLAAFSAGLTPESAMRPESEEMIFKRHFMLLSFRAALPGLFFITGHDLAGTLNLPGGSAGSFSFDSSGSMTRGGIARAPAVYSTSAQSDNAVLNGLAMLADMRKKTGIASGGIIGLCKTSKPATVAVLSDLPSGGRLLTVANFLASAIQEYVVLPEKASSSEAMDLISPQNKAPALSGVNVNLELAPWQCRVILLAD